MCIKWSTFNADGSKSYCGIYEAHVDTMKGQEVAYAGLRKKLHQQYMSV